VVSKANQIRTFAYSISADDRTRYFLKVQDGCDYFCSYCTIPFARGRSRNGSIAKLLRQAEQVVEEGGKEIVLTGVNIGILGVRPVKRLSTSLESSIGWRAWNATVSPLSSPTCCRMRSLTSWPLLVALPLTSIYRYRRAATRCFG